MKKLLLIITIFTIGFVNAQDVDYFSVITKGKKLKTDVSMDGEARFIVEMPKKTAAELYEMVQLAVSEQWVNPDEVIDGQSVNSYIKINGGASSYQFNSIGQIFTYNTRVSYNFRFKDGRFMYTVNMKVIYPRSQYSAGGTYPISIPRTKKNGKKVWGAFQIEKYNKEINDFIAKVKTQDIKNDDW